MSSEAPAQGGFVRNFAASMGGFAFQFAAGILYTPYIIHSLGMEVYGLIPLAQSVTQYLTVLTAAVSAAVGRFVTVDYARRDFTAANRTFNTFFGLGLGIAALVLTLGAVGSFFLPRWLNVPAGYERNFQYLLLAVLLMLVGTMQATCFDAAYWARNRFDLRSLVDTGAAVVRLGLVVVLFELIGPNLDFISLGVVLGTALAIFLNWRIWRYLTPELKIQLRQFSRQRLPEILGTSRWLFLNQTGLLLAIHVDLLLVNLFVGPAAGGSYAAVQQWANLLRTAIVQISVILAPTYTSQHAVGDQEQLVHSAARGMKLLGSLIALPVGLLAGFAEPLLGTWIGPQYEYLYTLAWVLLLPLALEGAQAPLFAVLVGMNRIGWASVTAIGMGVINLGLGILLARYLGWGMYGVAAASATTLFLRYGLFTPLYTAKILNRPWTFYIWRSLQTVGLALLAAAISWVAGQIVGAGSWLRLGVGAAAVSSVYAVFLYHVILDASDRDRLYAIAEGFNLRLR